MAIVLVEQPGSTPSSLADWTDSVETHKYYNLGVSNPVAYDFTGDTIKQGVQINIGGANYISSTVTAITGTPSDFVKITPSGSTATASYVSSLVGVTWNSVYNFYEDVSGNAYIFEEAKALYRTAISDPKTVAGRFALNGYMKNANISTAGLCLSLKEVSINSSIFQDIKKSDGTVLGVLGKVSTTGEEIYLRSETAPLLLNNTGAYPVMINKNTSDGFSDFEVDGFSNLEYIRSTTLWDAGLGLSLKEYALNDSIYMDFKKSDGTVLGVFGKVSTTSTRLYLRATDAPLLLNNTGGQAVIIGTDVNDGINDFQVAGETKLEFLKSTVIRDSGLGLTLKEYALNDSSYMDFRKSDGTVLGLLGKVSGTTTRLYLRATDAPLLLNDTGGQPVIIGTDVNDGINDFQVSGETKLEFLKSTVIRDTGLGLTLKEYALNDSMFMDFKKSDGTVLGVLGKVSTTSSAIYLRSETAPLLLNNTGTHPVLVHTATDDGIHDFQVAGNAYISSGLTVGGAINPTTTPPLSSWALTTTPMIIPQGIYSIIHLQGATNFSRIEMQISGSVWVDLSIGGTGSGTGTSGAIIFSDGINFRAVMFSGTGTMNYRKF
jgi:hypothetical protein